MKSFLIILFILFTPIVFSQNKEIKSLEDLIRSYYSYEEYSEENNGQAYQLLSLDKYNNRAISYLLWSYKEMEQKDSIPLFFNYLIENNPNDIEPYLIREKHEYSENLSYTDRINNLKGALHINPKDERVNYQLGKLYYNFFIQEYTYNKDQTKENLDSYSKNSIKYFTVVCTENETYKEKLKYPLLQLANYLGNEKDQKLYESYHVQNSHFPISAFVSLPDDWKTNYSVNVIDLADGLEFGISGIEHAFTYTDWYSKHLSALQEPVLNDSLPIKVYRFTYLRSFENPIVVRLESNNESISIYWKVSNGAGGYNTGEITENKMKKLTVEDWNKFEQKINEIEFWDLPSVELNINGLDGSQWILEGKTSNKYHVVDRWTGGKISSACKGLIDLTDIKDKDIY